MCLFNVCDRLALISLQACHTPSLSRPAPMSLTSVDRTIISEHDHHMLVEKARRNINRGDVGCKGK